MQNLFSGKNLVLLAVAMLSLGSCKNGGLFKKKKSKSDVTGWNYDDKTMGNFHVAKVKYPKAGPGLVFVQGGTFTMGAKDEDVMGDWNNVPRRVTVPSFFIDETEVANVHYREYLYWLGNAIPDTTVIKRALPDTLVWREELAFNEPYVEYYFRYPSYNYYPVVGVSWEQAHDFCKWRTDRVNELALVKEKYLNPKQIKKEMSGQGADATFNTETYLMAPDQIQGTQKPKGKNSLLGPDGKPRKYVNMEDGKLNMGYRLPTEAEWEYAAYGILAQNPSPRKKEGKSGEELISNQQIYSWSNNPNGLRDNRRGSWQGKFLANFKRGSGDNMGVAGGLNDRAAITGPVKSFYPNAFGLYNMSGNVSEWVLDVYRPMSSIDNQDFNYFRGNKFQRYYKNASGDYERDSLTGYLKKQDIPDDEVKNRRNYQRNNVISYLDGDTASSVFYGYGVTSLISDNSRVIKGGSWNDRPYWLSPGTRRFMEQDQAASTVGFRCAQTYLGPPEGPGFKDGQTFGKRKQNSRKKGKKK